MTSSIIRKLLEQLPVRVEDFGAADKADVLALVSDGQVPGFGLLEDLQHPLHFFIFVNDGRWRVHQFGDFHLVVLKSFSSTVG
jgi:hypothetical protein